MQEILDQECFILNQLKTFSPIENDVFSSGQYNNKQTTEHIVKTISHNLSKNFNNGVKLNQTFLLFYYLLSKILVWENGLYKLNQNLDNFFTTLEKINIKSSEAIVYKASIYDIPLVLKYPKEKTEYRDLLKEYYIGVTCINNLRCLVPNFVYTMGLIIHPKHGEVMMTEYIPGHTLGYHLKNNTITFEQYISIFIQILLALEVAQREYRFCHYDLHVNNIILRPIEKYSYSVVLDNKRYNLTVNDFIPVILDFGMTSVNVEDKLLGTYHYINYGMMPYMIPGVDMYKLLFHSYSNASDLLQRQITLLYDFYGHYDPYKILVASPQQIQKISKEYVREASFSYVATYTPFDFIQWLFQQFPHKNIQITERDVYKIFPNSCITTSEIYETDLLPKSYILLCYTRKFYSKNTVQYNKITEILKKNRKKYIKNDKKRLMEYTNIKVPNDILLGEIMKEILNINRYSKNKKEQEKFFRLVDKFTKITAFIYKLEPYFQYLYTIYELKLEKKYKKFIIDFTQSKQYNIYVKFAYMIGKVKRWCTALLYSI